MKKLKTKVIKKALYHGCSCAIEHGLPQYTLLKRHGMVFIDFDNDYMYLAYVDSNGDFKRGKVKKVKHFSQRRLFKYKQ